MNGDDHDRVLRLEEQMQEVQRELAERRGGIKTWMLVLMFFLGPIFSTGTTWVLGQIRNDQERFNKRVEQFIDDQERREQQMKARTP